MRVVVYFLLIVPFGSGLLTTDWPSFDPSVGHAQKITRDLLGRPRTLQSIFIITRTESDLDLGPYFRQLADVATVTVLTWPTFLGLSGETLFNFKVQVILLVMDAEFKDIMYLLPDILNKHGLRSNCKVVVIIPGVEGINQAVVMKSIRISFLRKHTTLVLFSKYAMLYQAGDTNLRNVTDSVDNTDLVFERRSNNFHGRPVRLLYMDDPPRSQAIDGRVTGLDGLYLDGYVRYMKTDYTVTKYFERRNYTYEMRYLNSQIHLLMFNIIDYVFPFTQMAIMFHMFGFTHQCLLVPKQPPKTMIDQFLQILQPSLVILLGVVFVAFGLVFYAVLRLRPHLSLGICDVYFTLLQITITNSVDRRMRTLFEKLSLLAYIVLSYLVVCGVQSFMKQLLVSPTADDIETIAQLGRANLRVITNNNNYHLLTGVLDAGFMAKVVRVDYLTPEMINRSFAYLWNEEDVDGFYYSKANFVNGVQQMHRMKECASKHYRGYVGPLDGVYEESLHFYLQAIEESGIRLLWEQQRRDRGDYVTWRHGDEEGLVRLVHLKKVFSMLFIGCGLASLVFFADLVVDRARKWRFGFSSDN